MLRNAGYIFNPELQQLLDHFCALFDIRIAFFSAQGEELKVGEHRRQLCGFCRILRGTPGFEQRCKKLDKQKRKEAAASGDMVSYECHAGLTEAIMPVRIGEEVIGFVMIGQFRCRRKMMSRMDRGWQKSESGGRLPQEFELLPYFSKTKAGHLLFLFKTLVTLMESRRLVELGHRSSVHIILAHMETDPAAPLSLTQAAELINRSPSTVSHSFKQVFGKSFKLVLTELRLEKAEEMLRFRPGITVKETAYALGFNDPLYFSRLFRKHRGYPPSELLRESR